MKITKSQLRRIIQEELTGVLQEQFSYEDRGNTGEGGYGKIHSLGTIDTSERPNVSLGRKTARTVEPVRMPHPGDPLPGEEPQFVGAGDTEAAAREDRLRQQRTAGVSPSKSHRTLGRRGFSNFQDLYARADALGLNTDRLLGKDRGYGRDEKMGRLTRGLMRRVLQGESATATAKSQLSDMDRLLPGAIETADQALAPASNPANALYQQTMDMVRPRSQITTVDPDNQ